MTKHRTGTARLGDERRHQEWPAERLALLEAEKELTRCSDELARRRQELPWVRIDKKYRFDTDEGSSSQADLFQGRSQLLVYHFMFGPNYTAGCPTCSTIADGFNGLVIHLANHDVMLGAVSRAPLARLQAYKGRMGWSVVLRKRLQLRLRGRVHRGAAAVGKRRVQLPRDRYPQRASRPRHSCRLWHRRGDSDAGSAGDERVRARGRRRLPHLLRVHPWAGRPLGNVPVARPRATRAQRDHGARIG
jgi:Bacterial protein of unknown function (DUF899)